MQAIFAICKRDMRRWFGSPTGYVFIALFVALAAAATFWPDAFFNSNLANLDTLNSLFPLLLLFFIPAVTMSIWAGERSQGTDELLLTLPASDSQVILGKYLASLGIYTASLFFCILIPGFLAYLGNPDWGLIAGNFFAYWLFGAMLLAAGMIGSQLSDNLTVAFILGAVLCGLAVVAEDIVVRTMSWLWMDGLARTWTGFGPVAQFELMSHGVITISGLALFAGLTIAFLYVNRVLLSRRNWRSGRHEGSHYGVRFVALTASAVAITGIAANWARPLDVTAEQIHSLSNQTRQILADLPDDRPVYVQAYVSPTEDVPQDYVRTRRTLLDLLRQYDSLGGDSVMVRVVEAQRYTDEAREADDRFGIQATTLQVVEGGRVQEKSFFLGVAFNSGAEEVVIPFLGKGLSVEYELTRSVRTVANAARRKVGVLDTDVKVFGGFDFQTMNQSPQWSIVRELELQYDVVRVSPDEDYPSDLDALIAAQASTLTQPQMDRLGDWVRSGAPTLLIDDPHPFSSAGNAPGDPKGGQRSPFQQQQPPPEPKGDFEGLLRDLNIDWPSRRIAWQGFNPYPALPFDPEYVFVSPDSKASEAFNESDPVTSGLQQIVTLFGGYVQDAGRTDAPKPISLLRTSKMSGSMVTSEVFTQDMFFLGPPRPNPRRRHMAGNEELTLACRAEGSYGEGEDKFQAKVIFIADLDMISDVFFNLRSSGSEDFQFDNVTFLLNCVDSLAGDDSFIELRKRRPQHRILSEIAKQQETFMQRWLDAKDEAEQEASTEEDAAQRRFDEAVAAIEEDISLDEQAKAIRIETVRRIEQRKLDQSKEVIEDRKSDAIEVALQTRIASEQAIENRARYAGVALAPIPAILFGIVALLRRRGREQSVIQTDGDAS